ncbi:MAG: hypothetical protein WC856_02650 [Methylococcaceae bacterium]|jgi:hypothetical protein
MEDKKECRNCLLTLDLSDFSVRSDSSDGRQSYCKKCASIKDKERNMSKVLANKLSNKNPLDILSVIEDAVVGVETRLTEERFLAIYYDLNNLSKKVYESTPSGSSWNAAMVVSELNRRKACQPKGVVLAALKHMVGLGIVSEDTPNRFIRVPVIKLDVPVTNNKIKKEEPIVKEYETLIVNNPGRMALEKKAQELDTGRSTTFLLENLLSQAVALRDRSEKLNADLIQHTNDIGIIKKAIERKMEESEEKLKKMDQLSALLKGFAV